MKNSDTKTIIHLITYTKKLHAHRVSLMMLRKKPCSLCPARRNFDFDEAICWGGSSCHICRQFVNISSGCPCINLGHRKALERTKAALKKYYKEVNENGKD